MRRKLFIKDSQPFRSPRWLPLMIIVIEIQHCNYTQARRGRRRTFVSMSREASLRREWLQFFIFSTPQKVVREEKSRIDVRAQSGTGSGLTRCHFLCPPLRASPRNARHNFSFFRSPHALGMCGITDDSMKHHKICNIPEREREESDRDTNRRAERHM